VGAFRSTCGERADGGAEEIKKSLLRIENELDQTLAELRHLELETKSLNARVASARNELREAARRAIDSAVTFELLTELALLSETRSQIAAIQARMVTLTERGLWPASARRR
jgi:hypothetical protein